MSKKKRSQRLVRYRVGGGNEDAFAKGRTARLAQVFDVRIVARRKRLGRVEVAVAARHGGATACVS